MKPLDDAYANAPYIPGADSFLPRWTADAAAFRDGLGGRAETGVSYGDTPRQVFDFFNAESNPRGTVVFVHGGYWKAFDHTIWSHFAGGAMARGWSVAMPGYDLCPDVRIRDITRQIARAVTAVADRTEGPIALTGHSAGGHLVSRMTGPGVLPEAVRMRLACVAPVSPVADLTPLTETTMNDILSLDVDEAAAESPVFMPAPDIPVEIHVGADERPVFVENAERLARVWGVEAVVEPERHHFDVIDALRHPDSRLTRFLTASGR
ncbi:alpha/beta hydrolase [uncultured Roseobacter sp.]|uniref:alpha/beta hydrolase n=1 Tax=uncultured Roseobacter sp. TaxID=114847 RepID=UPI002628535C|nr:alpha/beta hydrolase [uncultured Roseobacter sp.]